ncbi:MAG: DUF1275 domain-containing protein [Micromonosporaceae bacterium]|nr:DUF1275 domain-containing protein [Micromonosporaceae bacterium]
MGVRLTGTAAKVEADRAARPRPEPPAVASARAVSYLLVVLSAAAGCLDAVAVTRLGGPFASVITGNLVLFGRGLATADSETIADTATAIGGYGLGVAAATLGLGGSSAGWSRRTSLVAGFELVLLIGVVTGWLITGSHPGRVTAPPLLGLAAAAMGIQSAVTISTGVRGASTTYLTGTLTRVLRALVRGPHRFAASAGGASRLVALLAGAAAGGLLLRFAPLWAPVLATALVATVFVAGAVLTRPTGHHSS